jgi:hypothetical protein
MEAVKLHPKKPPTCTPEGAYAPKQCRGEVCFCVTPDGRPIPYYKVIRKLANSMECSKYISYIQYYKTKNGCQFYSSLSIFI